MNTAADWQKIDAAFETLSLTPRSSREELLAELCQDDGELRLRLEQLLAAEEELARGSAFLSEPLDLGQVSGLIESARGGEGAAEQLEIGGYRLGEVLGRGGAGIVYRALKSDVAATAGTAVEVALKVGWQRTSRREAERFRREQEILSRLAHPGIAAFFDFGHTAEGQPFLVMELIDGVPIDRYCDEHALSIGKRLALFDQLCDAVDHVHRAGIVHRDLKPGNVLVTPDGRVKLLDFGIAKALDSGTFHLRLDPTDSQIHLATPGYCSPEQLGAKRVKPSSDVYSLAVLLFELLTGTNPYRFESSSPLLMDILQAVYERRPRGLGEALGLAATDRRRASQLCRQRQASSIEELRRQLPRRLERALARALAQSPADRPANAAAFAAEVRGALRRNFFSRLLETLGALFPH